MLRIKSNFASANTPTEQTYVPLKQVSINAIIHSFAADVTITQVFLNEETTPIEAMYCFPIEEQAAVYSFRARIDNREIHAELKEKEQAQREYTHALQGGHGAYLFEQDEKSRDNFIINIGALLPAKECTITISYVTELEFVQGSTIRFVVPTTIAPRYNPNQGSIASPANTNSEYVQTSGYSLDFSCRIEKLNRSKEEYITRIDSPSHPIQIDLAQSDTYLIRFAQESTHLDRDILLNIELSQTRANTIVAVEPGALMAVFTPLKDDFHQGLDDHQMHEFVFIADCSGSMSNENKIGLTRQAMMLFLRSLPLNCRFNIIRFGSNYQSLFKEITVPYNEENARKAEELIRAMKADLGGTELLKPLQWLEEHSSVEGRVRQIFLLTDGEISNVTQVIDLCRSMAASNRIFSFGLGASPSRSLMKGLARSTNGRFVFIPPKSSVDVYVGEQLQKALQPSLTHICAQWNLGVADIQCAPTQLPPVYLNDRLIVYALVNDQTIPFDHNSSVELQTEQDHRSIAIAKIDSIPHMSDNQTIARLAAKALILELQHFKSQKLNLGSLQSRLKSLMTSNENSIESIFDEKTIQQRIVALSLKYNILSPHTSFIGIEKRLNGDNTDMVLREVPIEISADDKHLRRLNRYKARDLDKNAARYAEAVKLRAMRNRSTVNATSHPEIFTECCITLSARCADSSRLQALRDDDWSPAPKKDKILPMDDQDIVRYLINKQKFDGLWNLDSEIIQELTGKSFSVFQSTNSDIDSEILTSMIVILTLETRFSTFSSLWYGIVQKARDRILDLLGKDATKTAQLFNGIRNEMNN